MRLSCRSEQETVNLLEQICSLLAGSGYPLTKFMSNSQQILSQVPTENSAAQVEPSLKQFPVHKGLGVISHAFIDRLRVRQGRAILVGERDSASLVEIK